MKDLGKRTISSILFVGLILGPLLLSDRFAYTLYALLGLLTLNELLNMIKRAGAAPQRLLSGLIYIVLVALVYEWAIRGGNSLTPGFITLGVFIMSVFIIEVFRTNSRPFEAASAAILAPFFIGFSFLGIAYFYAWRSDLPGFWITASVFTLIWVNDAGAYLFGRKIGKRKLFERLSPNKTVEGSISGMITALATAFGLSYIDGMPPLPIMLGFGLVIVLSGSLGDLFESRMKRDAGVKDSGKFLPGHGGFFDRFDAMMIAIPFAILFFELFYPKA